MAGNIVVPLDISDPVVLRRVLVEIVTKLNNPTPITIEPSNTYNKEEIQTLIDKINQIINKN